MWAEPVMLVLEEDPYCRNESSLLVVPAGRMIVGKTRETLHVRRSVGSSPPGRSGCDLCSSHPHHPTLISPVPHLF